MHSSPSLRFLLCIFIGCIISTSLLILPVSSAIAPDPTDLHPTPQPSSSSDHHPVSSLGFSHETSDLCYGKSRGVGVGSYSIAPITAKVLGQSRADWNWKWWQFHVNNPLQTLWQLAADRVPANPRDLYNPTGLEGLAGEIDCTSMMLDSTTYSKPVMFVGGTQFSSLPKIQICKDPVPFGTVFILPVNTFGLTRGDVDAITRPAPNIMCFRPVSMGGEMTDDMMEVRVDGKLVKPSLVATYIEGDVETFFVEQPVDREIAYEFFGQENVNLRAATYGLIFHSLTPGCHTIQVKINAPTLCAGFFGATDIFISDITHVIEVEKRKKE